MNANILVGALVVFLLLLILLMLGLHVHAGWKWERQRREVELYSHDAHEQKAAARKGLNKAMVDALPTFIYNTDTIQSLKASKGRLDQAGMECPVCLCEFQHNEKCRALPKCSHRFHADCIDTWLLSNASCPVCRASTGPEMEISSVRDELRGSGINVHIYENSNIIGAGAQFPTNVLFWGNNSQVTSRVSSDHPPSLVIQSLVIQIHTQPDLIPPPSSSSSTDQPHASDHPPSLVIQIHTQPDLIPPPSSSSSTDQPLRREISKQVQHRPTQEQAIQIDDYSGDGGCSPLISEQKIDNHSGEYGGRSPSISGPKL